MITDKDMVKMKKVFVTKEDLAETNKSISALAKDVVTVLEIVGEVSKKLNKKMVENDDILEHHERQIDRLNDKIFPTT